MKTLLVTTPQAKIEGKTLRELVPRKLAGWQIEALPCRSLNQIAAVPDVTLVQLSGKTRPVELKAMIPQLVDIQARAPQGSYVLFSFKEKRSKAGTSAAPAHQRHVHAVVSQINQELPAFANPERVSVTFAQNPLEMATELDHIGAKLDLPRAPSKRGCHLPVSTVPRLSPLDRVKEVVKSTEDLRVANGNLSAAAVAAVFGVSLNRLAAWLGRTRQALSKTPDADSLQHELSFFERAARLRAVVPQDDFLKWLRIANPDLDDKKPLELLAGSERQVVADLVDDMLTGAPD